MILIALLLTHFIFTTDLYDKKDAVIDIDTYIPQTDLLLDDKPMTIDAEEESKTMIIKQDEPTSLQKTPNDPITNTSNTGVAHDVFAYFPYTIEGYRNTLYNMKEQMSLNIYKCLSKLGNVEIGLHRLKYFGYAHAIEFSFEQVDKTIDLLSHRSPLASPVELDKPFKYTRQFFIDKLEPHAFVTILVFQKYEYGMTYWSDITSSRGEVEFLYREKEKWLTGLRGTDIINQFDSKKPTGVYFLNSDSWKSGQFNSFLTPFQSQYEIYVDLFAKFLDVIVKVFIFYPELNEKSSVYEQLVYILDYLSWSNSETAIGYTQKTLPILEEKWKDLKGYVDEFPHFDFIELSTSLNLEDFDRILPYLSFIRYYCYVTYMNTFEEICDKKFNSGHDSAEQQRFVKNLFIETNAYAVDLIIDNADKAIPRSFLSTPVINEYGDQVYHSQENIYRACGIYSENYANLFSLPTPDVIPEYIRKMSDGWVYVGLMKEIMLNPENRNANLLELDTPSSEAALESCMVMVFSSAITDFLGNQSGACENNLFDIEKFLLLYHSNIHIQQTFGEIDEGHLKNANEFLNKNMEPCKSPNSFILALYLQTKYGKDRFITKK